MSRQVQVRWVCESGSVHVPSPALGFAVPGGLGCGLGSRVSPLLPREMINVEILSADEGDSRFASNQGFHDSQWKIVFNAKCKRFCVVFIAHVIGEKRKTIV